MWGLGRFWLCVCVCVFLLRISLKTQVIGRLAKRRQSPLCCHDRAPECSPEVSALLL